MAGGGGVVWSVMLDWAHAAVVTTRPARMAQATATTRGAILLDLVIGDSPPAEGVTPLAPSEDITRIRARAARGPAARAAKSRAARWTAVDTFFLDGR
jgi:hypothetical protein